MILCKDELGDEACWKLQMISSGSWKFISIKIWNERSTIVLFGLLSIEVSPPGGFSFLFFDQAVPYYSQRHLQLHR